MADTTTLTQVPVPPMPQVASAQQPLPVIPVGSTNGVGMNPAPSTGPSAMDKFAQAKRLQSMFSPGRVVQQAPPTMLNLLQQGAMRGMQSYHKGGVVRETGVAKVKKGEVVIPAEVVRGIVRGKLSRHASRRSSRKASRR